MKLNALRSSVSRNSALRRKIANFYVAVALLTVSAMPAFSSPTASVLTQHNDNNRSGADLAETALTPQSVNATSIGKLWQMVVNARIYAQPLYVPNVRIGGGTHNVVYIATARDSVYAYDADTPNVLYWKDTLGSPVPSSDYNAPSYNYEVIYPYIGIISTPVIDPSTNTLYCVANTKSAGLHHFIIHALNLSTGADEVGAGVEIAGTTPGTGPDNVGGVITFNAFNHLQRPALLLNNGVVYVAFGAHHDTTPGRGWLFAYSAANLAKVAVFCDTPNTAGLGSLWNSGQGPAADDNGYIYISSGNGPFDANKGGKDYGQSIIKLQLSGNSLSPVDYFAPWNYAGQDAADKDLGVSGPLLIPGAGLLLQCGKDGHFYVTDTINLGHFNKTNDDQIIQDFQACSQEIHGSPVFWQSGSSDYVYVWSQGDYLKQYHLDDGMFDTTPTSESSMEVPPGTPGAMLSVSANESTAGSGIVWALLPYNQTGYNTLITGVLRAFNADNISQELWDSQMNPTRDTLGFFAKFVSPTIANGKVYAASDSDHVSVYGLMPTQ